AGSAASVVDAEPCVRAAEAGGDGRVDAADDAAARLDVDHVVIVVIVVVVVEIVIAVARQIAGGDPAVAAALLDEAPYVFAVLHVDDFTAAQNVHYPATGTAAGTDVEIGIGDRGGSHGGNRGASTHRGGESQGSEHGFGGHRQRSLARF